MLSSQISIFAFAFRPKISYHYFMWILLLILCSYLIGSIPTSIIVGKLFFGIDIRDHGSQNPGATNAFRVLGKKTGIIIGLFDIFKGFFPVYFLAGFLPSNAGFTLELRMIIAGLAVVSGHIWTVFAGFKGGKGIGTAFGVFIALAPVPSLLTVIVWCVMVFGTGYVSLGSISAAVALPLCIIIMGLVKRNLSVPLTVIAVIVGILVIVRHRTNISRLLIGEENRFGKRGKR